MLPAAQYNNLSLPVKFFHNLKWGLCSELEVEYKKNKAEVLGDKGLWFIRDVPRYVKNFITDPRVVTVALTALALVADSFLFYPTTTLYTLKAAYAFLPHIPLWAVKFACYIVTVETIISAFLRAQGRFFNEQLMAKLKNPAAPRLEG